MIGFLRDSCVIYLSVLSNNHVSVRFVFNNTYCNNAFTTFDSIVFIRRRIKSVQYVAVNPFSSDYNRVFTTLYYYLILQHSPCVNEHSVYRDIEIHGTCVLLFKRYYNEWSAARMSIQL